MSNIFLVGEPEGNESAVFRKRSFAMEISPGLNENHKSDVSNTNEDSLTESVFPENLSTSVSSPIGHACTFPRSNVKPNMTSISDSVSSVESVFSSDHTDLPSSPTATSSSVDLSTAETLSDAAKPDETQINDDANSKPDETQFSDKISFKEPDVSQSSANKLSLTTSNSKSLGDLTKKNPVHKNTSLPRVCISSGDQDKVNDDSDDEDYVIPFLYNSDEEDSYVIASLFPHPDKYLALRSNSCIDGYTEVKDLTLHLSSSTTCDDDFRSRSDSYAYDYVKDFILPISPPLSSPSKTSAKHDALTKLDSDINGYEEVKDILQETPSLQSSTTCVEDDLPIRTDSDYEEVKDYVLQEV